MFYYYDFSWQVSVTGNIDWFWLGVCSLMGVDLHIYISLPLDLVDVHTIGTSVHTEVPMNRSGPGDNFRLPLCAVHYFISIFSHRVNVSDQGSRPQAAQSCASAW